MTWKETPRAAATLLRRRYKCGDCGHVFDCRHASADEPPPPCPACPVTAAASGQLPAYVAPMPGINGSKSKAIDLAQQMAEEDYGLTDINDNQRTGDMAFKGPETLSTADREKQLREMVEYESQTANSVNAPLPTGPTAPDGTRNVLVDPALQKENYWQGNAGGTAEQTVGSSQIAAEASRVAAAQGVDPVGILERGRKEGNMPLRFKVVGAETDIPPALAEAQAKRGAFP